MPDACQRNDVRRGAWRILLCVLICAAFCGRAPAQDMRQEQHTTAGGLMVVRQGELSPVVGGHAWIARQERISNPNLPTIDRTIILHLPPRTGGPKELRGVIRYAGGFESVTEQTAWWGNRVYFAIRSEPGRIAPGSGGIAPDAAPQPLRSILSLTALRGVGSSYSYAPGRPEVLPSLDGTGDLIGFVGTRIGPAALIAESRTGTHADLRLWLLSDGRWFRANLPWDMGLGDPTGPQGRTVLIPWRNGLAIATIDQNSDVRLNIGRVVTRNGERVFQPSSVEAEAQTVQPLVSWRQEGRPIAGKQLDGKAITISDLRFVEGASPAEDTLIGIERSATSTRLIELRASGPVLLNAISDIPENAEILAMASPGEGGAPGVLAMVWTEMPKEASSKSNADTRDKFMIREFSALTGREIYSGPARDAGLLTRSQYQSMVIVLLLVMISVVVFVLRGDPQIVPGLPHRTQFAEPVRRALATLLDYVPSAVAVALASGRGPMALLIPEGAVSGPDMDLSALGLAIALSIVHCTLGEWLFGRSLGKFLLGCRVIDTRISPGTEAVPGGGKPRFWQALVRNVVRWCVPILGIFVIFDPARRHPGDLAAQTIVVTDEPDEADRL